MPISNKEKKVFTRWMQEHNVRSACPACGSDGQWGLHESLIGGLDLDLKKQTATPSSAGFFVMVCQNCQYTRFFAAAPILGE